MSDTGSGPGHVPVMLGEVVQLLDPGGRDVFLDGTVGAGGHAAAILDAAGPSGYLLGVDLDPVAIEAASHTLASHAGRFELYRGSYADLPGDVLGRAPFDGILLDLGASSLQFDDAGRGFSFLRDGPLDMRMDPDCGTAAADLVNGLSYEELSDLIYQFGEEHRSRAIARRIVARRAEKPLKSTKELADIVAGALSRRGKRNPATKVFQALRIAVNEELRNLGVFLEKVPSLLKKDGRVAIISFHSLEDRAVKVAFRDYAKAGVMELLTRKPLTPARAEALANPRSRSAKLRVAARL